MKRERNSKGYYPIDGRDYISVTTVLDYIEKRGLHPWIAKTTAEQIRDYILAPIIRGEMLPEQLAEMDMEKLLKEAKDEHLRLKGKAMGLGSQMHKTIEEYYGARQDRAVLDNYTRNMPDLTAPILGFMDWEAKYGIVPIEAEHTVWHPDEEYAGTLDLLCLARLKQDEPAQSRIIVDFKSSNSFWDDQVLQLAAYAFAQLGMDNEPGDIDGAPALDGAMIVRLDKETGLPEERYYTTEQLLAPYVAFLHIKNYVLAFKAWKKETSRKKR